MTQAPETPIRENLTEGRTPSQYCTADRSHRTDIHADAASGAALALNPRSRLSTPSRFAVSRVFAGLLPSGFARRFFLACRRSRAGRIALWFFCTLHNPCQNPHVPVGHDPVEQELLPWLLCPTEKLENSFCISGRPHFSQMRCASPLRFSRTSIRCPQCRHLYSNMGISRSPGQALTLSSLLDVRGLQCVP